MFVVANICQVQDSAKPLKLGAEYSYKKLLILILSRLYIITVSMYFYLFIRMYVVE